MVLFIWFGCFLFLCLFQAHPSAGLSIHFVFKFLLYLSVFQSLPFCSVCFCSAKHIIVVLLFNKHVTL